LGCSKGSGVTTMAVAPTGLRSEAAEVPETGVTVYGYRDQGSR
jgi:hypothetical protein